MSLVTNPDVIGRMRSISSFLIASFKKVSNTLENSLIFQTNFEKTVGLLHQRSLFKDIWRPQPCWFLSLTFRLKEGIG